MNALKFLVRIVVSMVFLSALVIVTTVAFILSAMLGQPPSMSEATVVQHLVQAVFVILALCGTMVIGAGGFCIGMHWIWDTPNVPPVSRKKKERIIQMQLETGNPYQSPRI